MILYEHLIRIDIGSILEALGELLFKVGGIIKQNISETSNILHNNT